MIFHHLQNSDFKGVGSSIAAKFKRISEGETKAPTDKQLISWKDSDYAHKSSPNVGIVESISGDLVQFFNQISDHFEQNEPQYLLNKEILKKPEQPLFDESHSQSN